MHSGKKGKQHLSSLNLPLKETESHSEQEMEKNLLFPQSQFASASWSVSL